MKHYPLKFRRIKKKLQPRLRTQREFLSNAYANLHTVWGTDMLSISIARGLANDPKRVKVRKDRKRKMNHQKRDTQKN